MYRSRDDGEATSFPVQAEDRQGPSCLSFDELSSPLRAGSVKSPRSVLDSRSRTPAQTSTPTTRLNPERSDPMRRRDISRGTGHEPNRRQVYSSEHPRYPKYKLLNVRLSSFSKWPRRLPTPHKMAEAGLFYTGLQDGVRCFQCNGGMRNWDDVDDPWTEHARCFPNCPFVRANKGDDFVELVRLAAETEEDEQNGHSASALATGINNLEMHEPSDTAHGKESENPIYSPAAQYVITKFGFPKEAVSMAIEECNKQGRQWNAEVLVNVLLDMQDRGVEIPCRPEEPTYGGDINSNSKSDVKEENRLLKSIFKCVSCDDECNMLFLPCGHHLMCQKCAACVDLCPKCGKCVTEKIKTFIS